jgi:hypothetical protein
MARRAVVGRETELQLGSERFAEWRRTRRRGTPIPVELWERAGGGARSAARGEPLRVIAAIRLPRGFCQSACGFFLPGYWQLPSFSTTLFARPVLQNAPLGTRKRETNVDEDVTTPKKQSIFTKRVPSGELFDYLRPRS